MRKGSTRSSYAMRLTGENSDEILQKPSKKLKKLSSVGEKYQSTSSKRDNLPKKFFDGCGAAANQSSVPRKLRSAMKKRHDESVSPCFGNGIRRSEMPSKDCNKKLKVETDERPLSTMSESITEQITEDEKEVMASLLSIAETVPENDNANEINLKIETSEAEASSLKEKYDLKITREAAVASKSEDLVRKHVQIQDLNEVTNTLDVKKVSEDFTDGAKSRKRCALHVYICRIIKDLQHNESKPRDYTDAETFKNGGKIANKTPWNGGSGPVEVGSASVGKIHGGVPVTRRLDAATEQVAALPYFGSPLYDPSQWSRPVFPKHQTWMNPFVPGARYQNSGRERTLPLSGSYVGTSPGSNYVQPSLVDVLGSKKKDARNMAHQLQYKMLFDHRSSSGYEENRGSVFVDSTPTLKLTL